MTSRRHFFGEDFRIARTKATEDKEKVYFSFAGKEHIRSKKKRSQHAIHLRFMTYGLESEPPAARGGGAEAAFTLQNRAKKV